jgi:hypothetical protein
MMTGAESTDRPEAQQNKWVDNRNRERERGRAAREALVLIPGGMLLMERWDPPFAAPRND